MPFGEGDLQITIELPSDSSLIFEIAGEVKSTTNQVSVEASAMLENGQDLDVTNDADIDVDYVRPRPIASGPSVLDGTQITIEYPAGSQLPTEVVVHGSYSGRIPASVSTNGKLISMQLTQVPLAGERIRVEASGFTWILYAPAGSSSAIFAERNIPQPAVANHREIAVANLDSDAYLELVVLADGQIQYWENLEDGGFKKTLHLDTGTDRLRFPRFVDANGDGNLELSAAFYDGQIGEWQERFWLISGQSMEELVEQGSDALPFEYDKYWHRWNYALPIEGDLDGDGDLDRVVWNGIEINNGDSSAELRQLEQPGIFFLPSLDDANLVDFDGDNDLDLIAVIVNSHRHRNCHDMDMGERWRGESAAHQDDQLLSYDCLATERSSP